MIGKEEWKKKKKGEKKNGWWTLEGRENGKKKRKRKKEENARPKNKGCTHPFRPPIQYPTHTLTPTRGYPYPPPSSTSSNIAPIRYLRTHHPPDQRYRPGENKEKKTKKNQYTTTVRAHRKSFSFKKKKVESFFYDETRNIRSA